MKEYIKIITSTELLRVRPEDLVCIEADGNYSDLVLYTGQKRKLTFKLIKFEEIFSQLTSNPFIRVGKSLIVNKALCIPYQCTTAGTHPSRKRYATAVHSLGIARGTEGTEGLND